MIVNAGFPGDFHSTADGFRFRFRTLCASEDLWRSVEMEEKHKQSVLISLLRQDQVQLWTEPFISDQQSIRELAQKYVSATEFTLEEVISTLESIRADTSKKDEGNKQFKETAVASLELHLPRTAEIKKRKVILKTKLDITTQEMKKLISTSKRKVILKTKLDITTQELKKLIGDEYGFKHFNLILMGQTLSPGKRLDEQNVKNNSKIMVLVVSSEQEKTEMLKKEEKKRQQDEGLQRTQKGFQILSERDGSEDPVSTPYLEIADQKGNPLQIPDSERKALILAMGFHEKGRALMKKRNHSAALTHLLQADEQFNKCNSALLRTVDNYAVLQLDVVWCYQALQQLDCLNDARQRLERAEDCFKRCYGEQQSRLQQIKGHTGGEDVLFLRLYLLQSLLAYHDGNKKQALNKLRNVEELLGQLCLDPEKMLQLRTLGRSRKEARLGLRACRGDVEAAERLISQRKKEKKELKDVKKPEVGCDDVLQVLLDGAEAQSSDGQTNLDQLLELGFQKDMADSALRLMGDDLAQATQMLLDNQGVVPPDLLSPSPPSSSSEEPSTSSDSTASAWSRLDEDLVNEVLEDIPRHEEDYLDLTLDEEQELMLQIRSSLEKQSSSSG
ncbi:NEDD8 ultimate buster 1-like [Sinocyclocheilus rhinocerous]|uniref:NEDD8 ultimate buster 1-like n=1 Tax=Sinocyclocheilus rhinocerous TaxID=307959 RepID=UPI0007B85B1D|nr:PREDICTED: NEDD8 ultimate buster 1-like [Sinocyclocheilus rhinocerous]